MGFVSTATNQIANSSVGGNVVAILQKALWLQNKFGQTAQQRNANRAASAAFSDDFAIVKHPQYWPAGIAITTRLQETYTYQSEVTRHAVESGAILSDHVILYPVKIDLAFEVSNFDGLGKTKKALEDFVILWASRKVFDLMTEHKILKNMVCASIQADNSVPEWGKLAFRASFQQVTFVSLETVKFPASKVKGSNVAKSASTPVSSGNQVPRTSPVTNGKTGIFKGGGGKFNGTGATGTW